MGMNVVPVWDGALTNLIDTTTTANITYVGEARPGSNTTAGKAAAIWRISAVDTTVAGNTTIGFASQLFNQIWNNRASLTYT